MKQIKIDNILNIKRFDDNIYWRSKISSINYDVGGKPDIIQVFNHHVDNNNYPEIYTFCYYAKNLIFKNNEWYIITKPISSDEMNLRNKNINW